MNSKAKEIAAKLKPKHLAFANGILENKTQEKAYIDAGYAPKGARHAASLLLTNVNIQEYIKAVKEDVVDNTVASIKEIAQFHTKAIRNDPRSFKAIFIPDEGSDSDEDHVNPKGTWEIVNIEGGHPEAIEGIKFDRDGRPIEIKFVSKAKAAEDLGKHLGYFDKDNEQRKPSVVVTINEPSDLPNSDAID